MWIPPLTPTELDAYHRALTGSHVRTTEVYLLDLDGRQIQDISRRCLPGGQVDCDAAQPIKRSASLSLLDPDYSLGLDDRSPYTAPVASNVQIQIWDCTWVEALDRWVRVPVITGPIDKVERPDDGAELKVTILDRATLGTDPRDNGAQLFWPAGTRKTTVIRDVAQQVIGETRLSIPDLIDTAAWDHRLGQHGHVPWEIMRTMADSLAMRLFYDAEGTLRLERWDAQHAWTFTTGTGGSLLTHPSRSLDSIKRASTVRVLGAEANGAQLVGWAHLPAGHPLSAESSPIGGIPWDTLKTVEDTQLLTQADVDRRAVEELDKANGLSSQIAFDALPIPFLDAGDLVTVDTGVWRASFRLERFSLSLDPGGRMSISQQKIVTSWRHRI